MRDVKTKILWFSVLACLAIGGGCGWYSVLPPPVAVEGWEYSEPPESYDPETLYNYINGKARVYLEYGFVKLDHVQFAALEGKPVIDVDVYDMGSPVGAFGIYSLERGDDLPLHYKKRLGYMIGSARFFWEGQHYVAITSPDRSPETIDAINALSLYVENSLPGDAQVIPLLAAFPEESKVPESEQYFAIDFLGHQFMGGGFMASYQEKGGRFKLFVSPEESSGDARQAYQKLRAALSEDGEIIGQERGLGQAAFLAQDDYLGNWLVSVTGRYVVGATGFHDIAAARKVVARLCRNLSALAASTG